MPGTSSAVEIDFFHMERESSSANSHENKQHIMNRRPSLCDIQVVISKINPELLKTAIASVNKKSLSSCSSVLCAPNLLESRANSSEQISSHQGRTTTAPLTIFYHGKVAVFDVSHHQAEDILKLALGGSSKTDESTDSKFAATPSNQTTPLMESLGRDLPFARKKSLRRFLEKRKERQTSLTPYASPSDSAILVPDMNIQLKKMKRGRNEV